MICYILNNLICRETISIIKYQTEINGVKQQDDDIGKSLAKSENLFGLTESLPLPLYKGVVSTVAVTTRSYIPEQTMGQITTANKQVNPLYLVGKMDNNTEDQIKTVLADAIRNSMAVNETDEVTVNIKTEDMLGENG